MAKIRLYMPLAFTAAVAAWMIIKPLIAEGSFDATDVAQVIAAVTTAAVVFLSRNVDLPGGSKIKTVMTGIGTVAGFCAVAFIGGLDSDEFIDLAVLLFGFIGVSVSKQPAPVPVVGPPNAVVDAEGAPRPPAI